MNESPTFTLAQLDGLVATIETDIRQARDNEMTNASHNLHGNALEYAGRAKGLEDARVRVLALIRGNP